MSIVNDKSLLRIGRGRFFARRYDPSGIAGSGFRFCGQVTSIQYQPNETKLEEDDMTSAVGSQLASVTTSRKPTIKATFKSFEAKILAMAVMGDTAKYTQPATGVTGEAHLNVQKGSYIEFGKMGPVTSVAVTPAAGGTAFTVGDDYTVQDGKYPMLYIVPGGAIADGDNLHFAYTPTAYTNVEQIKGATEAEIDVALRLISSDSYGPQYNFDAWKASVNIDAVLEFIQSGNEFGSFEITFTLQSDEANHAGNPYIDIRRVDNAA